MLEEFQNPHMCPQEAIHKCVQRFTNVRKA